MIARVFAGRPLLAAAALALSAAGLAAGSGAPLPAAPVDHYDRSSMQRGAAVFMNYCIGCHGARHARYKRIADDLGLTEGQSAALLNGPARLVDHVESSVGPDDGREWFSQAVPPDLTLVSRVRGPDWVYAFLRGYYRDPETLTGWNNLVFENTAMPHVLHGLQGIMVRADSAGDGAAGGPPSLELALPGGLSAADYDSLAGDLTNFLVYMGDPGRNFRIRTGIYVLLALMALLVYTHFLYREYWRDIG